MKRVSIIIPYYNRERLLERTLWSVKRQTYRPVEIILVDNASTDHSAAVARRFKEEAEDGMTVHLLRENTPGAAAARNCGLRAAQGEYVYFFDSDDELSEDFLVLAMERAVAEEADVVAAPTCMVFENGKRKVRFYGYSHAPELQILTGLLSTQTVLVRRDFLQRVGDWNEELPYWNDWEWGLRILLQRPRLSWIKFRSFHQIHLHAESITGKDFTSAFPKMVKALRAAREDLQGQPDSLRCSCEKALGYRTAIMAGHLRHEGRDDLARNLLQLLPDHNRCLLNRLLYSYTAAGLPAAWRLARLFL